jgi:hypothetical protein
MAEKRSLPPGRAFRSRRHSLLQTSTPRPSRESPRVWHKPRLQFRWADSISTGEWEIYRAAIHAVRAAGIRFMLGGGFALATFMGRWRDTKDIDFYIHPSDRNATVAALTQAGFVDYFSRLSYDRKWIYRSVKSDVIVDIIWSMANQRAQVDDIWFERAGSLSIRGEEILVLPQEEFMWCKLYILQRDHCDWTDLFNLLYANGPGIDWPHLLRRLGEDTALLRGMLTVYSWLCPSEARKLPAPLWAALRMSPPRKSAKPPAHDRIRLLDSRCWFAALQPEGGKLDV